MRPGVRTRLAEPRDAASLHAFRFLFGVIMAAGMVRLLAKGWVGDLFVRPTLHFTYPGFSWVRPWPGVGMYVHVAALAAAALGIALGLRARLCAAVFFVGFTYLELLDRALYLNHYYLATLLAGMLVVLPFEGRRFVPAWVLHAFRAQVGLVYVYAGVAKLNADWLLRAQPLRAWLAASADLPVVGAWLETRAAAYAASWAGAAFDLSIVPLLLWKRTRVPAFAALLGFHAATAALFNLGLFPFIMTAGATLFLAPGWPRRFGVMASSADDARGQQAFGRARGAVIAAHLAVQMVLPLRQQFNPGSSAWTGAGFNFAWNVMVAEKSGAVVLRAVERATGREIRVSPSTYLSPLQETAMAQDASLIAALARLVAAELEREGHGPTSVYADAHVALNGRPSRLFLDPTVDLARSPPAILPFDELGSR